MDRLKELLRFWLTFEERVSRRAYLLHGAGLMALKYGVDAALVGAGTGTLWTPLDYLSSGPLLLVSRFSGAEAFLAPALTAWTLPFLWIGVTMTIRRLLDVGWSAWWSLLFFVPLLNYALLLLLGVMPGSEAPRGEEAPADPGARRLPTALLSMALGGAVGLALSSLSILTLQSYGLSLFMGTPFVMGLVTAYALCRRYPASLGETMEVVVMTVLLVAGAGLVVGIEGAVCLLMAAPLGLAVAAMGGVVGRYLARVGEGPLRGAALILVLVPGTAALESGPGTASLREVRTAVVVDAPPEAVWREVVAFSPIRAEPPLLFRLGVAHPLRAEIDGTGVGAVRYCVFSTGAFVEPITAWEPGRRLAFDVVESPRPLEELSFRKGVSPPHLEGYLAPRAGEFRMVPLEGGRTRLEGSTWYEQRLRPEGYWVWFSDRLIGRIHRIVLEHVRDRAEAERDRGRAAASDADPAPRRSEGGP